MRLRAWKIVLFSIVAAATIGVASARAADCGDSAAGFDEWLTSFKQVAISNGISQQVVDSALNGVVFDSSVAAHDRGQNFGSNFRGIRRAPRNSGPDKEGQNDDAGLR